ncbi:alpha/beta hydrolase [Rhodococcus sp. PAMC28707]|uniref:alpha/beta hydrolase n=1 Tax=unclassified Rhodococcus (in: high G+C Gram-positive bacteria) TaxID=192944 RepID=UPI00109E20D6|nr:MULTISPECIES: alpha/beta hydrolase [unclassified Rhodococcus (in: high G+C Gram-positive bacteria)]QCB50856.1 alpha/beta hydrolase [Rhodococcus sp. PAMC28705]QCB57453.1 alpha/beta hydrolase [Rhodococcus sp. PAMC28707]
MTTWVPDVLGDGYEQTTIPLGADPDGEGQVEATLVRYQPADTPSFDRAVIYVHGFTDYFFQQHLAEHFAAKGYAFYALDLRKCGRSLRAGQTPHFVTDLAFYDDELNEALSLVRREPSGKSVLLLAHSTGGLILPLWLDRLNRQDGGTTGLGIDGVILNSPWFDLQGPAAVRSVGTTAIGLIGKVKAKTALPGMGLDTYGLSLAASEHGEWDYNLDWKPLSGFPITFGWIRAIRHGHAKLHRGLDIGIPSLILRSKVTHFSRKYSSEIDAADAVLDVRQIARWAGCLGDRTTIVPIEGARHDVFLSQDVPRARAFDEVDEWLEWLHRSEHIERDSGRNHNELGTIS